MDKNTAGKKFADLYKDIDGYALSRKARMNLDYSYEADVYGEVDFDSFYDILTVAKPQKNEIFYDLGSGTGKAVVIAALCFPFSKCIGVEYLKNLYQASYEVGIRTALPSIHFMFEDFNTVDFTDADVLYLNSYYFYYEMTDPVFINKVASLKSGSRLIFVHTPLVLPYLEKIHEKEYTFSWGRAKVYIMIKK